MKKKKKIKPFVGSAKHARKKIKPINNMHKICCIS